MTNSPLYNEIMRVARQVASALPDIQKDALRTLRTSEITNTQTETNYAHEMLWDMHTSGLLRCEKQSIEGELRNAYSLTDIGRIVADIVLGETSL